MKRKLPVSPAVLAFLVIGLIAVGYLLMTPPAPKPKPKPKLAHTTPPAAAASRAPGTQTSTGATQSLPIPQAPPAYHIDVADLPDPFYVVVVPKTPVEPSASPEVSPEPAEPTVALPPLPTPLQMAVEQHHIALAGIASGVKPLVLIKTGHNFVVVGLNEAIPGTPIKVVRISHNSITLDLNGEKLVLKHPSTQLTTSN